jgi:hypothetical protein
MVENGVVSNGGQRTHVVAARVLRGEGAAAGVLRVALGTLALCASARVEVPLTPVPFTLQVLALCLVVLAMRPREAVSSAASYVLVGSLGAPVFSGGMGGVARIAGPTGGFIWALWLRPRWARLCSGALLACACRMSCARCLRSRPRSPSCTHVAGRSSW